MTATIPNDAEALALAALSALLTDARRAERFLALTGLSPDGMRLRLGDPAFLAAGIAFLEGHEPDLVAVCEAMGVNPQTLLQAKAALE